MLSPNSLFASFGRNARHAGRSENSSRLPVLCIAADRIEWLFDSGAAEPRYLTRELEPSPDPQVIAAAAIALADESGQVPRRCIVVLAESRCASEIVAAAGVMGAELESVLLRRAAQVLNADARDTLFCAIPLSDGPDGQRSGNFAVWSARRGDVFGLQAALRRFGVEASRVVAERGGFLARAGELLENANDPFIVVGSEYDRTYLALACRGELVTQSALPLRCSAEQPEHAVTLIQELRNLGGYWRRSSRGEELAGVVALGLDPGFSSSLEAAVRGALGGVEFIRGDGTLSCVDERVESLASARARGPLALDFGLRLPPKRGRVAALTGGVLGLSLLFGVMTHRSFSLRLESVRDEVGNLRIVDAELEDLEQVWSAGASVEQSLSRELDGLRALATLGIDLDETLATSFGALGSQADLLSLAVRHDGQAFRLSLSGVTDADPLRSKQALSSIGKMLSAAPRFLGVELAPPASVPDGVLARELPFSLEARLAGDVTVARTASEGTL